MQVTAISHNEIEFVGVPIGAALLVGSTNDKPFEIVSIAARFTVPAGFLMAVSYKGDPVLGSTLRVICGPNVWPTPADDYSILVDKSPQAVDAELTVYEYPQIEAQQ